MISVLILTSALMAQELPGPSRDGAHPGSMIYPFDVVRREVRCRGRDVVVFHPSPPPSGRVPLVIYGHGQALGVANYEATLRHLARKGAIAVHPQYDQGFFDQNWLRMGRDYVELTDCAIRSLSLSVDAGAVVFSGHSKGAYVAGVAAGLAFKERLPLVPGAVVLFQPAGINTAWRELAADTEVTLVHSEGDTIVSRDIARELFAQAPVKHKQLAIVKNYRADGREQLVADHFWPLTKRSFVGGGPEGALHYHGSWKWLTAAAFDLIEGGNATQPYLYGDEAASKGRAGEVDEFERSFSR